MEVNKLLKTVNNVDDYISATQNMLNEHSNSKIQFNMSTVLALKKVRSIEIEYFTKYGENGAAVKILDLLLRSPPSKTWALLGKELILLFQYWLDALRKHLIVHNSNWWSFLSVLLKFIQEIRLKNAILTNILIQETAECLLDLATQSEPDVNQRYKILQCLNSFCAESSREIRFALKDNFEDYFIKLGTLVTSCGDLRTQYSIMETLLRWLLPRQDLAVRKEASAKWFPSNLYKSQAVDVFLRRPWQNFFKDARDFLNAQNEASDLVTSIICRKFSIGNVILISGNDRKEYYIDLNCGSKCVSLMLEPRMLEILNSPVSICEALTIDEDNTNSVQLYRKSPETLISLVVMDPLRMYASNVLRDNCDVTVAISSRSNMRKLDRALRNIFHTKYQLLMDIEEDIEISPRKRELQRNDNTSEDDTRFSHPIEIQRRQHSGYIVRARNPVSWQSPSTASTSSLAMLREKLTAFPGYRFDKEPVSVCAQPQLSSVTEVTETDGQSLNTSQSTLKLQQRSHGVCHKKKANIDKIRAQNDNEGLNNEKNKRKFLSPILNDSENSVSCLLVATIGSANDSVINDTLERLPKEKDIHTDNIVDMLAQEALQSHNKKSEVSEASDIIENKAVENALTNKVKTNVLQKKQTIISNSTTDESNTEVFEDTPNFINLRRKRADKVDKRIDEINIEKQTFNIQAVEDFFSQHFSENRNGDLVISPTLAKKINETSSESSEPFDFDPIINIDTEFNFSEVEIVECLNDIVEKVCQDFDKCTEYLNKDLNNFGEDITKVDLDMPLNEVTDGKNKVKKSNNNKKNVKGKDKSKPAKGINLNFKKTKVRGKNKLNIETLKQMSPIIERDSVIEDVGVKEISPETSLIKRKRKLYSPKDDHKVNEEVGVHISETEEDTMPSAFKVYDKTPKSLATSYKEIDSIRRDSIRKLRNKKPLRDISVSPRTKKMNDLFDDLKKTKDNEEKIILADKKIRNKKLAEYNFSSDSDEEEFKTRTVTKKSSTATIESEKSKRNQPSRRGRSTNKIKNSDSILDKTEEPLKKNTKSKNVTQKSKTPKRIQPMRSKKNIIDQRMRDPAPEVLNTSMVIEIPNIDITEPEPNINKPEMEIINDIPEKDKNKTKKKNKVDLSLKKRNETNITIDLDSDRETSSPLPGLIVEKAQVHREADDSITVITLENLKNISQKIEINDLNTTQNLLTDLDQNNNSPPKLNVTDEFNKTNHSKIETPKKVKTEKSILKKQNRAQIRTISDYKSKIDTSVIESNSGISIDTTGKSPITAHGYVDQSPPNSKELNRTVEPRNLEIQDLNQSMKDYYEKLTNEINDSCDHSKKNSDMRNISVDSSNSMKIVEKENLATNRAENVHIFAKSPSVSIERLSPKEINRWLPPRLNSVFGSNQSSESEISVRKTRSYSKNSYKSKKSSTNRQGSPQMQTSLISPIKMYGEVGKVKSVSSHGDDFVDRIKSLMTRKILKPQNSKSNHYSSKKAGSSSEKSCNETPKETIKRKSSPILSVTKMKKVDSKSSIGNITVFESDTSSSIHEWFKRNDQDKQLESLDHSLRDHLEQVMEKLDTTLVEIHHMTSKKFVSMFVDAQKHLNELKENRRRMYQETAKEIISDMVKIMDRKFMELDKRSQELDEQFINIIKEKARHLIHEDCKQKRVMVTLLREDIQAVVDHIQNKTE
ncbi:unnamed protein product, partial [Brenthis ino]